MNERKKPSDIELTQLDLSFSCWLGLCPTDSVQMAKCDMIVDTENDLAAKRIKYYYEKDEKLKV